MRLEHNIGPPNRAADGLTKARGATHAIRDVASASAVSCQSVESQSRAVCAKSATMARQVVANVPARVAINDD